MISIGIAGTWPPELAATVAVEAEARGFARLWVNDIPGGDALEKLAAAARVTHTIRLGSGVISIAAKPAETVAASVASFGLPIDRLDLGIGSGGGDHPLARVRDALDTLRSKDAKEAKDAKGAKEGKDAEDGKGPALWVGALGPKMRELAATRADGILLNWVTPEAAREQTVLAAEQAAAVGRPAPQVAVYVRTAVDPQAAPALAAEAARYASFPQYAANFTRLGVAAADTAIGPDADVHARLAALEEAVGEVVVRLVLPGGPTLPDALRLLDATAP